MEKVLKFYKPKNRTNGFVQSEFGIVEKIYKEK